VEKRDGLAKHQVVSFSHAFDGIAYNIKTQIHFRIHLAAAALVVVLGTIYKITPFEWIILVILITSVMAAEAMNTAIEETCNMMHPEIHPHARFAKHTAAASVLILSIGAAVIGAIIFVPKIFG